MVFLGTPNIIHDPHPERKIQVDVAEPVEGGAYTPNTRVFGRFAGANGRQRGMERLEYLKSLHTVDGKNPAPVDR